ncbi:trans-1,2-dihydrobenzene-1,2-diol dehydrogenase [Planoprotostelium fungivorum]|uniref:D-xylose 1-dehydrogenase (NADP(+), D-xylono-1,5-lactone-forming) n=1 Tax=Planoprotostelium fungivorum TaxID=1890364 RepID=A0A2P6N7H7_9EUKA|nr:trans-1,2-dihydrobenzene-1,2-diol dehydrogenase [Planoprotostelium fungivorum]PRP79912.1 trans-1,2-dihydrobenzene-1,2-diol dehydrogenase [Planoprotostelium fungivorum]
MTTRGWVIVGTGLMGKLFPPDLIARPGNQIVGIVSRNKESAIKLAKMHGVSEDLCFTDFDAAVNRPEVHVVYLGTPPSEHSRQVIAAVKHGKAVLCEKPFTTNKKEAVEAVEFARKQKVFLLEALFSHYTPLWTALRQIFRGEHHQISITDLGRPLHLEANIGIPQNPDNAPSLFSSKCGGGALGAVSVYPINLAYTVFGERPTRYEGKIVNGATNVDEVNDITFEYEGGAKAHFLGRIREKDSAPAIIKTENGEIIVDAPWWCPKKMTVRIDGRSEIVLTAQIDGKGYGYEVDEVNRCLDEGLIESPVFDLNRSIDIMDLMDELKANLTQ